MANELALILKSPVEELIPKMISWNNAELLARVEATLEQYKGVTYDDSQIATAKADRAQLNAFCKALNDERIRIGKVYNAPYEKFKGEVDEVLQKVKGTVSEIDAQVKAFEERKQQEKQNEIIEYFKATVGDFSGLIPYERIHNPKWLNASTTMKSVKADIDAVFENARNALVAIEALKSEDEELVKAFYFRTLDLSAALMEDVRLKAERARVAEMKARQEQAAAEAAAKAAQEMPQEQAEAIAPAPKMQVVRFQVEGTVEQLKALQRFLKENKIKFSAI